jgi:spermidine/putrescine-binding protein
MDYKPLYASGKMLFCIGWNGDALALEQSYRVPIKYVVPEEGTEKWENDWVISAQSPNPELAHQFLNFMLRAEIAAQEAKHTLYATPNAAALELLPERFRGNPTIFPPESSLDKLEIPVASTPESEAKYRSLWAKVRSS